MSRSHRVPRTIRARARHAQEVVAVCVVCGEFAVGAGGAEPAPTCACGALRRRVTDPGLAVDVLDSMAIQRIRA